MKTSDKISHQVFAEKFMQILDNYTQEEFSIASDIENGITRYRLHNEKDKYFSHHMSEQEKELLPVIKSLLKKDLEGLLDSPDYQMKNTYFIANIAMRKELLAMADSQEQMSAVFELLTQKRSDNSMQFIYTIQKSIQDGENLFDKESVNWALNVVAQGFDFTKSKNEVFLLNFFKDLKQKEFSLNTEQYDKLIYDHLLNSHLQWELAWKDSNRELFLEYLQTHISNPVLKKEIFCHVLEKENIQTEITEELKAISILNLPIEETILEYGFKNEKKLDRFFQLVCWHLENQGSFIGIDKANFIFEKNNLSLSLVSKNEDKPNTELVKRVINTAFKLHFNWIFANPVKNMEMDVFREDMFSIDNIISMEKISMQMEEKYHQRDENLSEMQSHPKMKI
jgi:hypothetical protein